MHSTLSTPPLPAACFICFIGSFLPVAHCINSATLKVSVIVNRYSSVPVLHLRGVNLISTLYSLKLILYQCISDASLTQSFSNPLDTGIFPWGQTERAWCCSPSCRVLVHNVYLLLLTGQQISDVAVALSPFRSPLYMKVQTVFWPLAPQVTATVMNAFWWMASYSQHTCKFSLSFLHAD
jgi:hypothetical protein